ncbi:uncharacterized protein MELLADRAFT_88876 [Melampsora larici-populina 98AG31]|uniref:Uncharacterized protein n=1 Tax=Melampsora larici-populina (strain 98AG31 / pathotype 3-4-7) TaxID=747676 RepID=F4R647_MELLP|nr:uncharacterized protein MELLADRAFT_88876 [Melampsora larici-populina 98AG31]EGG11822.1 hypothetical protein MELLADRAFT_88876 [Melampsora larici-populina 98AG31]
MTSIDPSHFPFIGLTPGSPTGGTAIHQPASLDGESSSEFPSLDSEETPAPLGVFSVPDLRFEQGYLMSIRPFFYLKPPTDLDGIESRLTHQPIEDDASNADIEDLFYLGKNFRVKWGLVAWVTVRDQIIYPMMQGCLWGTLSLFITHAWRTRRTLKQAGSNPINKKAGFLGKMVENLFGGVKSNVALSA